MCWLSARGAEVGTQIVRFAVDALGLPQPEGELDAQLQFVWSRWPKRPEGDRVLLIYDDVADQVSADGEKIKAYDSIKALLPSDKRFQVLLTTRLQNMAASKVTDFRLDLLSEAVALDLLKAIVGAERIDAESDVAKALCKWVGYLPLGLELLGYFLVEDEDCSLAELLQRLEKNRVHSEALVHDYAGMTAELGVIDAFELSWSQLSDDAQALACWLSLFALAPIAWELATAGIEDDGRKKCWEKARSKQLRKLSLLQRLDVGIYQLHQLVREFFLAKLEEREDREELKMGYCGLMVGLAQQIGQSSTQEVTQAMTPVVPHIAEVVNSWTDSLSDEDFFWPFSGLTFFYYAQGIYDDAIGWAAKAEIATEKRFGAEHPDVATSLNNLAGLYESQGRYEDAEPLYLQALELRKQLLGEQHPDVATSLNNLAELYRSQGRYEDAEPLYLQALELRKQLLGEQHPSVATSLNNLAGLYRSQGRYEDAEPLQLKSLEINQKVLGENHPSFAIGLGNLASLYVQKGDFPEAESFLYQALQIFQRVVGTEHPYTNETFNRLVNLIATAIQANQVDTLSDHPMTQDLIPKIRAALESQENP